MRREETAQLIAVLSAAFPGVPVPRETVEVYHDVLCDLDGEAARGAVREILLTAERFPAAAAIRRKVAERAGVLAPDAGDAWGEVVHGAARYGLNNRPTFSHPAIDRVVAALGWRNVCLSENPDTLRAHFLKTYEVERAKADTRTLTDALAGLGMAEARPALGVAQ